MGFAALHPSYEARLVDGLPRFARNDGGEANSFIPKSFLLLFSKKEALLLLPLRRRRPHGVEHGKCVLKPGAMVDDRGADGEFSVDQGA